MNNDEGVRLRKHYDCKQVLQSTSHTATGHRATINSQGIWPTWGGAPKRPKQSKHSKPKIIYLCILTTVETLAFQCCQKPSSQSRH